MKPLTKRSPVKLSPTITDLSPYSTSISGSLSQATLKMVGARDANKESEEKVERIFGLADKDSDEKLSVDEFIEAAGKIPDFEEVLRVTLK